MSRQDVLWAGFLALVRVRRLLGDPLARLMSEELRSDPYPEYARIGRRAPVAMSMFGYVTARHALCDEVLRDPERFSSAPIGQKSLFGDRDAGQQGPPDPLGGESMIGMDPPDHTRLRRVVGKAFTRRAVERLRPRVEQMAGRLLDDMAADAPIDLMSAYAGVLPVALISELLGIPPDGRDQVKRWGDDLAATLDVTSPAESRRAVASIGELHDYLERVFAGRRAEPGELVIDNLLAAEGAAALGNRELMATAMLLLAAGFETTVNLIGNGVFALLRHPEQLERLVDRPELLPGAVDEILRWDPPVQNDGRIARFDTELGGVPVRRRRSVVVLIGGANRDPAVFADPDTFDIGRTDAHRHLSFAAGPHYCIGASLARLEGEIALGMLLERYPRLRLAAAPVRRRGLSLRGLTSLPVRLT